MSLFGEHLASGETVTYRTHLHWMALRRQILRSIVCDALAVAIFALSQWRMGVDEGLRQHASLFVMLEALLLLAGFAFALAVLWGRKTTTIIVTNQRLLARQGLIRSRSIEIPFRRIESIIVEQSPVGRLLDYGDVTVRGVGGAPEIFPCIDRPMVLRCVVEENMESAGRDA